METENPAASQMPVVQMPNLQAPNLQVPHPQMPNPQAPPARTPIEAVLRSLGLPANQIRLARLRADLTGEHLAQVLADFGLLSGESVARAFALEHGQLAYFSPEQARAVDALALARLALAVPDSPGFVPVAWDGHTLTVAVEDGAGLLAAGNAFHRYACRFVFASRQTIRHVWGRCFSDSAGQFDRCLQAFRQEGVPNGVGGEVRGLLLALLRHACHAGASDIHLYRTGSVGLVRVTVDGVGQVFRVVSEEAFERLITRLIHDARIREDELRLAGLREGALELAELASLPEGRFLARYAFRVELGVARSGRTAVIRVLDRDSDAADFDSLGFDPEAALVLRRLVQQHSGLVLVTGPTGSGKTTTLYALLKLIDPEQVSIQSIEHPVEYHHGLWMQYEVRRQTEHEGLEWARWLKGLLRNAPRVILMGEVRDGETARILMEAANTGHLVFTTLHANSAASAVGRLRRLGVAGGDLADALQLVLAQRLLRCLCLPVPNRMLRRMPRCWHAGQACGGPIRRGVRRVPAPAIADVRWSTNCCSPMMPCANTSLRKRPAPCCAGTATSVAEPCGTAVSASCARG